MALTASDVNGVNYDESKPSTPTSPNPLKRPSQSQLQGSKRARLSAEAEDIYSSSDEDYEHPAPSKEKPRMDPVTGMKGAFPGLDDGDGEMFYGPANDGIEYLRMVRYVLYLAVSMAMPKQLRVTRLTCRLDLKQVSCLHCSLRRRLPFWVLRWQDKKHLFISPTESTSPEIPSPQPQARAVHQSSQSNKPTAPLYLRTSTLSASSFQHPLRQI